MRALLLVTLLLLLVTHAEATRVFLLCPYIYYTVEDGRPVPRREPSLLQFLPDIRADLGGSPREKPYISEPVAASVAPHCATTGCVLIHANYGVALLTLLTTAQPAGAGCVQVNRADVPGVLVPARAPRRAGDTITIDDADTSRPLLPITNSTPDALESAFDRRPQ